MYLIPSHHIISQQTKEGICLLHTIRGQCHILNSVAAFIWQYLDARKQDNITPEELANEVTANYGVSYETALSDVKAFINEAIEAGIIVTSDGKSE